jgi:predicted Zn-dependent protease
MSDDELAIVLGHELAHYSHEHSRRAAKAGMWTQFLALGALVAADQIDNEAGRVGAQLGALLSVTAFDAGYSRNQEDQADRVGLRYAHEAGYDVGEGPRLWERFRQKYGNGNKVANFFFGGHSRPSDRIKNIRRELAVNYPESIE